MGDRRYKEGRVEIRRGRGRGKYGGERGADKAIRGESGGRGAKMGR